MLVQLYIENVAVIQKTLIRLTPGLNVFTGETGAGKTVIISAVDAVLGERTSRDIIRTGADKAVVSALFEDLPPHVLDKVYALGYTDDEGALLISREITAAGKSSCKIGGRPATTAILREITALLLHIHGQRDSHQLLLPDRHMEMLDAFGEVAPDLALYRAAYTHMCALQKELTSMQMDDAQKAQRMDMLTFQIAEIEAANLTQQDEEEVLQERCSMIRHSAKIVDGLSRSYAALNGCEEAEGIHQTWDALLDGVSAAAEYVGQFKEMADRLQEIGYELSEFSEEIRDYLDDFAFDPQELQAIEYRLDVLYKLKRKYGANIPEILAFYTRAQEELEALSTSGERADKLTKEWEAARLKAEKLARKLTQKRLRVADRFTARIQQELSFLDMPSVTLTLAHQTRSLGASGADDLEFLVVTNVGEQPKPLSKIASGGEVARMMLAIKNVLADHDQIATLIFDEVDTGVSGRAAQKIGRKLAQVSRARQVICVTHLAQVAAFADTHLYICKEVEEGRTFTKVSELSEQARVEELARIMSGDAMTQMARQNAQELLAFSRKNAGS